MDGGMDGSMEEGWDGDIRRQIHERMGEVDKIMS